MKSPKIGKAATQLDSPSCLLISTSFIWNSWEANLQVHEKNVQVRKGVRQNPYFCFEPKLQKWVNDTLIMINFHISFIWLGTKVSVTTEMQPKMFFQNNADSFLKSTAL